MKLYRGEVSMNTMTLGEKIRELRVTKGLTQSELGSGVVTPSMISQIESDKARPSYAVLEAIAKKLDTPIEYFVLDVMTQLEASTTHRVGQALLAAGKYDEALPVLQNTLKAKSGNLNYINLHCDLGDCYLALKQYEASEQHFREALELAETRGLPFASLYVLNKMGVAEKNQQKYHSAVHYWRTAYERFNELVEREPILQSQILMNLGIIHRELGESQIALPYFQEAHDLLINTREDDQIADVYLNLGLSYRAMKEYAQASEYLQYSTAILTSIKNIKMAIETKRQYGIVMGEQALFDQATKVLLECIGECKCHQYTLEEARVHNDLARVYLLQQMNEEAKEVCVLGLGMVPPEDVEAAYLTRTLAQAEAALGHTEEAIQQAERAMGLFQQHNLLVEVSETLSMQGDLHQAVGNHAKSAECFQAMKRVLNESLKGRGIVL